MMASMRNGQGDYYFILFTSEGAILKGFDHESPMSPYATDPPKMWAGILDEVPAEFSEFLKEPAFSMEDTTFCFWRLNHDSCWKTGSITFPNESDPDGSTYLLSKLDGRPQTYKKFAEEYYEQSVPLSAVEHIYNHQSLTIEIISALNSDNSLENLEANIEEIDYPRV